MSFPTLEGPELIAWVERTSQEWRHLLARHPEALQFPCDIRETQNVAGLLQHIVAVELRYAELLIGVPQTSYEALPCDTVEAVYAVHARAVALLSNLDHDDAWWRESIDFATRSAGTLQAPRRVLFFHALLHSVRHYAQLATIMRHHGVAADWMMDYLAMR